MPPSTVQPLNYKFGGGDVAPNSTTAVNTADLTVVRNRVAILHSIDLNVAAGKVIGLIGPNGAGKSTLLKCLAGLVRIDRGHIEWFSTSRSCSPAIRRRIGYAGHEHGLYLELTALENLIFAARMFGLSDAVRIAKLALHSVGLLTVANKAIAQLSQGMRQRVSIARATLHDPQLVLLDEPFASLDGQGHAWLESLFATWQELGKTVCFVSHDINLSRRLADKLVSLESGSITDVESIARRSHVSLRSA